MSETLDAGVLAFCEHVAPLVDGPRVQVLSVRCQGCGETVEIPGHEGEAWTVAAGVLRALAVQPHSDNCDGQMQFETEPLSVRQVDAKPEGRLL